MTRSAALLFGCAALLLPIDAALAQQGRNLGREIREHRERLDSIRDARSQLEASLEQLRGQMYTLTGELQNIERQKTATERIVNELDRQIGFLNAQIDTVTLELLLAQDAYAERQAVLERRLTDIYKRGRLWPFQVLLAAESFGDLLSRYKYLSQVSRQDRALVEEVEELRDRVQGRREQLVDLRTELEGRRDDRGDELGRYTALEQQRQRALRTARAAQQAATTRLDSLTRAEEQLTSLLASLEEARRRALARGEPVVVDPTISEDQLGRLDWPAEGPVLYRFGRAAGPDGTVIRRHGIGIRVPVGTPVTAVAAGSVVQAGFMDTYGLVVILDHGGGYYTLYLYLSQLEVRTGQFVARGELVGRSGGQNSDEGPHLEFQIRSGEGTAIALDPENWLRRRR